MDTSNIVEHKRSRRKVDYVQMSMAMFGTLEDEDPEASEDNDFEDTKANDDDEMEEEEEEEEEVEGGRVGDGDKNISGDDDI